ncbi:MAG: NAD(P)/FAD-dependent oxidoreductase [Clostridium sp.]|nr:NAD(P)/FAD-dependent oxidoreductase [Bacteroides sp.]MCM1198647.1 NAD(P)/FAD-dependent oxidoreductase [Clostridium sp.]
MASGSVIIIGSGLGGLECGYILAKKGMDVTILEQNSQIGGCLQSFVRGRALFDTGFHYVGGLNPEGSLYPLFRYFGLMDLPWVELDRECFDEVVIGDRSFPFASGHGLFAERLTEMFPREKDGIRRYTAFLKEVGEHIFDSFKPRNMEDFYTRSLFSRSAYEFLEETISDPLLRKVLSGTSLKMELNAESLPLYVFAQINNSFIQSSWRLRGGGSLIADSLAASIRAMGGKVLSDSKVTSMRERDGRIAEVVVNGEQILSADWVISSVHPSVTLSLVEDTKCIRKIYRSRMSSLENTFGMFTANVRLKPDSMPYMNRNIYVHRADADLWRPSPSSVDSVLLNWAVPYDNADDAISIDLLSPMHWSEVEKWTGTRIGHRGEDYVEFKNARTEACIELASRRLPELRDAVDRVYTSTPLSYHCYTGTCSGSAYGVRKDWRSPMTTVLTPKTPVANLLLTGQSLNLHGILGVSMTSVFTCASILGMDAVAPDILAFRQ